MTPCLTPVNPWPTSQPAETTRDTFDTTHHDHLHNTNKNTMLVTPMKRMCCTCTHTHIERKDQNKGGYPVFPEPTTPRIGTAGRYFMLLSRLTLLWSVETSLVVFSHTSLSGVRLKWQRRPPLCDWRYHCSLPALRYLHQRPRLMLHRHPPPRPYLRAGACGAGCIA